MDAARRLKKKRPISEVQGVQVPASIDMNKKRKTSEATKEVTNEKPVAEAKAKEEAKPWEGKEEQEKDYRWDICENCQ